MVTNRCFFVLELRPADILKVTLPGMGALTRWYVASKTHYPLERDSAEVPRGKRAERFEKIDGCTRSPCSKRT